MRPIPHGWCYYPSDIIRDDELAAAGFTVAEYYGESGDSATECSYRLAGIDAGGYDFLGGHHAPLAAAVAAARKWLVPTDNGPVYFQEEEEE